MSLMPVSPEKMLSIARDGALKAKDKRAWILDDIHAALCIIFGGAQFKEFTDLWAVKKRGMFPPPLTLDFICRTTVLTAYCGIWLTARRTVEESCWKILGLRSHIG